MPTYEYQCPQGHEFELFQKMSDKPRAKCPSCGKIATRKISGGAGLVFKGSGFYITDYGKDGKGPRKEGSEKTETAERSEKPAPIGREGADKSEGKAASGDAAKHLPGKSEGRAEGAAGKPAPKGKGKASSE